MLDKDDPDLPFCDKMQALERRVQKMSNDGDKAAAQERAKIQAQGKAYQACHKTGVSWNDCLKRVDKAFEKQAQAAARRAPGLARASNAGSSLGSSLQRIANRVGNTAKSAGSQAAKVGSQVAGAASSVRNAAVTTYQNNQASINQGAQATGGTAAVACVGGVCEAAVAGGAGGGAISAATGTSVATTATTVTAGGAASAAGIAAAVAAAAVVVTVSINHVSVQISKPVNCYSSRMPGAHCRDGFDEVERDGIWFLCCPEHAEESSCYEVAGSTDPDFCYPGYDKIWDSHYEREKFKRCCPRRTCFFDSHCNHECPAEAGFEKVMVPEVQKIVRALNPCTDLCCPEQTCYWDETCFAECAPGFHRASRTEDSERGLCGDLCCPEGVTATVGDHGIVEK